MFHPIIIVLTYYHNIIISLWRIKHVQFKRSHEELSKKFPNIDIKTYDERFTSKIAKDSLIVLVKTKKYRRNKLDYKTYYAVISKFFEILIRDVVLKNELIHLPNDLGYVYLDKKEHKRAFHYRIDLNESNK